MAQPSRFLLRHGSRTLVVPFVSTKESLEQQTTQSVSLALPREKFRMLLVGQLDNGKRLHRRVIYLRSRSLLPAT